MIHRTIAASLAAIMALTFAACQGKKETEKKTETRPDVVLTEGEDTMAIAVTSPAFEDGGMIPKKFTCDGENISPPLNIGDVPTETRSLTLIADDPDAPGGTWVHWVLYNLPPKTTELPESMPVDEKIQNDARHGVTDFREFGYGGPCPPSGTHRYYFKVYALDTLLDLSGRVTKADVVKAMQGHVLAEGQLMGRYARQK
jgi:Raf kinase inhibitor-like YbhB/YbcL family protein